MISNSKSAGKPAPQIIEIAADLRRLSNEIPIPGHYLEEGDVPSPSYQWYAWIGHRPIILEREAQLPGDVPGRVFIHTTYLEGQDRLGDWTVLRELAELPRSICITRPSHIMSRIARPDSVLFRPDPAGWDAIVYSAASNREAEECLAFLKRDPWNASCFIGPPEPESNWCAIEADNGRERILCFYPVRNAALMFACRVSSQNPTAIIVVKDRDNLWADQYFVSHGKVVEHRAQG